MEHPWRTRAGNAALVVASVVGLWIVYAATDGRSTPISFGVPTPSLLPVSTAAPESPVRSVADGSQGRTQAHRGSDGSLIPSVGVAAEDASARGATYDGSGGGSAGGSNAHSGGAGGGGGDGVVTDGGGGVHPSPDPTEEPQPTPTETATPTPTETPSSDPDDCGGAATDVVGQIADLVGIASKPKC